MPNLSVIEQVEHEVAKVYSKEQRLSALTATVLPHDCRRWLRLGLLTLLVYLFIEAVSSREYYGIMFGKQAAERTNV
jgi:hypothetical protein